MIGKMTTECYESDFSHVCLPSLFEGSIFRIYPSMKYPGRARRASPFFMPLSVADRESIQLLVRGWESHEGGG